MTYTQANAQLTGRNKDRRKLANNTYLERRNDAIAVRLHNTDVVTLFPDESVKLDSGGWLTVTTKARINDYAPSIRVWSERGVWFAANGTGETVPYADGITYKNGKWSGIGDDPKALFKLKKTIKRYVDRYMAAFDAGDVPAPSTGDCWGCLMKTEDGKFPIGGKDHIMSHMSKDEQYFVPSLLRNAIDRFPVSQAARAYISDKWAGTENGEWCARIGREQVAKSIKRWINEQLGMQG